LIAFLHLWLKFWDGIDKYCIVPVRKLFYFHHWLWRNCQSKHMRKLVAENTSGATPFANLGDLWSWWDFATGHQRLAFDIL